MFDAVFPEYSLGWSNNIVFDIPDVCGNMHLHTHENIPSAYNYNSLHMHHAYVQQQGDAAHSPEINGNMHF